jgi:site-specific recombinase XerD
MPNHNWDWLRQIANRLHLTVRPRPYLETQLVPIQTLYQAGLSLIQQSQSSKPRRPSCIHIDYRDGLMIALLASMPVRLQNLANIEIGRHLLKSPEGYSLIFLEDEVKNRQHIEVEVYEPLVPIIDRYLTVHRSELLAGNETDYLWISKAGQRMRDHHVAKRITKVTRRELGKPISPHLFRHCTATSIAEASPELARIIRLILAHTTTATSERYYNRASVLRASQRHTDALQSIRDSLSEFDKNEVT